jgi:aryl-alcohol dehydrogenase-like predicted oxidoreductase
MTVQRRIFGSTGMSVSEFALGTMMFGTMGNTDHDECIRVIHTAIDAGINFIDTADVYSNGESEEIVGKAIKGRREDIVLATKFALSMGADANERGGSRLWIIRAVEDSLRRLDTDYIDLYQMHRPDPGTDIDETLAALSELVRSGKVRQIGASTFPAELIVEAQWAAVRGGHRRFTGEQPRYSILTRTAEAAVLPTAQRHRLGVLTYGPLASGWLSGRPDPTKGHRGQGAAAKDFDLDIAANRAKLDAVEKLSALAAEAGMALPHMATAFVLTHPAVTSVLLGPRTPKHLQSSLDGAGIRLDAEILDRIDEIVAPGTEVNPDDNYYTVPELADSRLRRRDPREPVA